MCVLLMANISTFVLSLETREPKESLVLFPVWKFITFVTDDDSLLSGRLPTIFFAVFAIFDDIF